jgi:hypothetical protein
VREGPKSRGPFRRDQRGSEPDVHAIGIGFGGLLYVIVLLTLGSGP